MQMNPEQELSAAVRPEKRAETTWDVEGLNLTVEELRELLGPGRRVEEFRGFLRGIDTAVEREPDRV
jgi:hypothetical protein